MLALIGHETRTVPVPPPDDEVLPGVRWGRFDEIFTPAFWFTRAWYEQVNPSITFQIGENLTEEIVACLLGGHGLPAEVGLAAFARLKEQSLLHSQKGIENRISAALNEPLCLGCRWVRYRYPNQRAYFIARALQRIGNETAPMNSDSALRDWLTTFEGIGLKTASWITRNVLESDKIAILDIHVVRAGKLAGIFTHDVSPVKEYYALEARLIDFAMALGVRLSILDALIWAQMRVLSTLATQLLNARVAKRLS
jgi:N-glycosylase/DNA lyase